MKALVVDDSKATRFILGKMLKSIGCEIVEAENGQQAIDQLNEHNDCVFALVDWNMPVMTGYEMVQNVRSDNKFDDLKIMMVTTETEMEQVVKAIEAGANEYIMKPFTEDMVLDKLKMLGIYAGS